MRLSSFAASVLLAITAKAQVPDGFPPFFGELLIKPSLANNMCLTLAENRSGANVVLRPCVGGADQKWVFRNGSVAVNGDKCLDVTEGVNANQTLLQGWSCNPAAPDPNQSWYYNHWEKRLVWNGKTKCMDVPAGNVANETKIHIWDCRPNDINQSWDVGYMPGQAPEKTQPGQYGTSRCGTGFNNTSTCQTVWVNSAQDFCLFAPPEMGTVGDNERRAIAYCTGPHGARPIPNGTLQGVHFVKTSNYVQVTGVGNFTNINIPFGDAGGEIDNRGADGTGNPAGGLLYSDAHGPGLQQHEWTQFISYGEFCIRACFGDGATKLCNHIYDVMGCYWNIPANYQPNQFENCEGDLATPMGIYGTSTWYQGVSPTPVAHPAPKSSQCTTIPPVTLLPTALGQRNAQMRKTPSKTLLLSLVSFLFF